MSDNHTVGRQPGGSVRWAARPAPKAKGYGPDPGCQPCPDCGGLECLCRPRFFAGQLLTEQDLNRLDHYIVEKHKLHNRHLFGSGVVCGLVVTCAPCDELVNVSPGYALSPCGEDIVVCKPDSVDICALIARCRDIAEPDCRPYAGRDACDDVEEEWILAIRYLETPSRPQTPLVGPATCACGSGGCKGKGCACGGGCGCSGGGASNSHRPATATQQPRLRRGAPPTCEPTVTCESYRYEVFRKPEDEPRDPQGRDPQGRDPGGNAGPAQVIVGSLAGFFEGLDGEMAARIACCLRELEKALPRPPGAFAAMTAADRQAWFRWCCAVRSSLSGYYARIGGTDCEAMEKLAAVPCPSPDLPLDAFKLALQQSVLAMLGVALEAMLHCICSNVLPPCPAPGDPRVPLASVTVRKRDCHIVKVCNWTPLRGHVVTFPTLGYWLGWIPLRRILRDFMEQLCCQALDFGRIGQQDVPGVAAGQPQPFFLAARAGEEAGEGAGAGGDLFAQPAGLAWNFKPLAEPLLARAFAQQLSRPGSAGGETLTQGDLFDLVFRRPSFAKAEGLEPDDEAKLTARLAGSGLMKTLADLARSSEGLLPGGLGLESVLTGRPSSAGEVAELRHALDAQARQIEALKARLDAGETGPKPGGGTRGTATRKR